MAKRNRVITCVPIIALVTLLAVSLQLNGLLMMWKIYQAKKTMPFGPPCCGNEIIRCVMKLRCYVIDHLTHTLLRRIHPGNRDGVLLGKISSLQISGIATGQTLQLTKKREIVAFFLFFFFLNLNPFTTCHVER